MNEKVLLNNTIIARQWDKDPVSILKAMKLWPSDRSAALGQLKAGQINDEKSGALYDLWSAKIANFWDSVFYLSLSKADFSLLRSDLKWQLENEWNSIDSSLKAWNAQPRKDIWAYYNLLWGQRNNPAALKNYRACWKEDKARVMSWAQKISQ